MIIFESTAEGCVSDNRKYYYLKLRDNYFEQDSVRVLEGLENGAVYSLIILKICVRACKFDGNLRMTERIPYTMRNIENLANVIGHDVDHVRSAIKAACELDIISILDTGEIWVTDMQSYIGQSSTEADRKRKYRKKISNQLTEPKKVYPFKEIVEHLNELVGSSFKYTSRSTQDAIKARVNEGYTLDDFKRVHEIKYEQWHNNNEMVGYLRPSTLYRPTKFEGYLNEWKMKNRKNKKKDSGMSEEEKRFFNIGG
jgi:uncharacterized phage protein (TIGR02220 family)/predicted phage replisome organizer